MINFLRWLTRLPYEDELEELAKLTENFPRKKSYGMAIGELREVLAEMAHASLQALGEPLDILRETVEKFGKGIWR